MLLLKKFQLFLYLFLVKTRQEIRFNNVLDRKETFFDYKNQIFQSPKNRIFPKELTHAFGQKMPNFSLLDLVKMRLEKMLINFDYKNKMFRKSPKWHFSKGLNPCYSSKNANSFLFVFGQNEIRNKV